jgi:hypothetical protein
VVEALLPIMNTAKVQPRWHMLGCLVAIAQNGSVPHLLHLGVVCILSSRAQPTNVMTVSCAKEVVAKGGARISEYCSNPAELLITRHDDLHHAPARTRTRTC